MPRTSRMIIDGEKAVYHVMSRTALDGFPLKDVEKDFMLDLVKNFSLLYFTEILGLCLMGNHFHLLVKMIPEHRFTDAESIDSDIVRAILRIRASSGQRNLWPKITSDLNIYFTQNKRKSQNRLKVWMGCIH